MKRRSYFLRLSSNLILAWILPTLLICMVYYGYTSNFMRQESIERGMDSITGSSVAFEKELKVLRQSALSWVTTSDVLRSYANKNVLKREETSQLLDEINRLMGTNLILSDVWINLSDIDFFLTSEGSYDEDFFFNSVQPRDYRAQLLLPALFQTLPLGQERFIYAASGQYSSIRHQKEMLVINNTLTSFNGRANGYTAFVIDPMNFFNQFAVYSLPDNARIFIIDQDNSVIIANTEDTISLNGLSTGDLYTMNDTTYLYIESPSDSFKWKYGLLYPYELIVQQLQNMLSLALIICLVVVAVGAAFSFVISRRLYQPVLHTMNLLSTGEEYKALGGRNEFEFIGGELSSMISKSTKLEQEFMDALEMLQQSVIRKLLSGEIDDDETHDILLRYHIHFPLKILTVLILLPKRKDPPIGEAYQQIRSTFEISYFFKTEGAYVVVINDNVLIDPELFTSLDLDSIGICVSSPLSRVADLPQGYAQARFRMHYLNLSTDFEFINDRSMEKRSLLAVREPDFIPFENQLTNLLESANYEKAISSLEQTFDRWFRLDLPYCTLTQYEERIDNLLDRLSLSFGIPISDLKPPLMHSDERLDLAYENIEIRRKRYEHFIDRVIKKRIGNEHSRLEEILTYIDIHLGDDLSRERVTEQFNISYAMLSRAIKERFDMTYLEYVTHKRMAYAKELLHNTSLSVEEISRKIGYMTAASFIRNFNRFEGISPGQYRKNHTQKNKEG